MECPALLGTPRRRLLPGEKSSLCVKWKIFRFVTVFFNKKNGGLRFFFMHKITQDLLQNYSCDLEIKSILSFLDFRRMIYFSLSSCIFSIFRLLLWFLLYPLFFLLKSFLRRIWLCEKNRQFLTSCWS